MSLLDVSFRRSFGQWCGKFDIGTSTIYGIKMDGIYENLREENDSVTFRDENRYKIILFILSIIKLDFSISHFLFFTQNSYTL